MSQHWSRKIKCIKIVVEPDFGWWACEYFFWYRKSLYFCGCEIVISFHLNATSSKSYDSFLWLKTWKKNFKLNAYFGAYSKTCVIGISLFLWICLVDLELIRPVKCQMHVYAFLCVWHKVDEMWSSFLFVHWLIYEWNTSLISIKTELISIGFGGYS